jgi:molecular chaperone HscB
MSTVGISASQGAGVAVDLAADDFVLFGLPMGFALDLARLDERWKALQAAAHPDRHASGTPAARRLAMQWAVRINEAHRRLKDPLLRATYLCELHGQDVGAEHNTAMPAEFLMQQMSWREALADAADVDEVESLAHDVGQARAALLASLETHIDGAGAVAWTEVTALVRRLMFVERFGADIDRRVDALQD